MSLTIVGTYRQGTLTAGQLQAAIGEALLEVLSDGKTPSEIGVSPDEAKSLHIDVKQEGGFDAGILITIGIAFASGMASEAGKILLRRALKRVKEEHGDDALGDPSE